MIKSEANSNFYYWHQEGKILIVMLYVDDLVITNNFEEKVV
jgi:hypothetical protein